LYISLPRLQGTIEAKVKFKGNVIINGYGADFNLNPLNGNFSLVRFTP